MIILRYLSRELLQTTVAVTLVLMVVIMSGRFVKYLADAAAGRFDAEVLLSIMFYRIPGFLELILPLGFLVALLMAYGRLYAEQEMTALFATGFSQNRLLTFAFLSALPVSLTVGFCSLWLSPLGLTEADAIIQQQKQRNELDTLKPGRFQRSRSGAVVSYSGSQTADKQQQNVFIASVGTGAGEDTLIIRADSARRIIDQQYRQPYLWLSNGVQYQGRPGGRDYRITHFEGMARRIGPDRLQPLTAKKIDAVPTAALLADNTQQSKAALQWRLSAPLSIIAITFLGVALSHTTPRRGRYAMLFPAILLYLLYVLLLNAARGAMEENTLAPTPGLWLVHALFILFALTLFLLHSRGLRWPRVTKSRDGS